MGKCEGNMCYIQNKYRRVKQFDSQGSAVNEDNNVSQEIKARAAAAAERSYYSIKTAIGSRSLLQRSKIQIHKT